MTHAFSLLIFFSRGRTRILRHASTIYTTVTSTLNPTTLDRYIAVRNSATVPQMSAVWTASVPSSASARDLAQSAVTSRKWDKMPDGFHEVTQFMIYPNLHMLLTLPTLDKCHQPHSCCTTGTDVKYRSIP